MKGRIPQPTTLNTLKGDPGKRRRHTAEPLPPKDCPECPPHLDAIANEEWDFVTTALDGMGLLTSADRTTLEMYCSAYSRYRKAEANVNKYGEVILAPSTSYPMVSPYSTVMNKAQEQCRKYLIEFGLTPAARARMRVEAKNKPSSKWAGIIPISA